MEVINIVLLIERVRTMYNKKELALCVEKTERLEMVFALADQGAHALVNTFDMQLLKACAGRYYSSPV